jgi:hypothetical protein
MDLSPAVWFPKRTPVIGAHKGDAIPGTRCAVGRASISYCYDEAAPPINWNAIRILPDGVLRLSLVPVGQLGELWFTPDDPDAVYAVPWGVERECGLPVILEHIKNYAAKERRA